MLSFHELFLGTVAGFLFSAALVVTTRLPAAHPAPPEGSLWHRTTLGARIFARTPELRGLMALNLVVAAATALVLVNTVVYAGELFGGSNADVALALACFGAGSMVIALAAPRILDRASPARVSSSPTRPQDGSAPLPASPPQPPSSRRWLQSVPWRP